ncbi:MAG: peptide chain release factor N(5)-glutamine methyltransferase [Moraxellaceae bacterium]|nr:peptide chain release factor N(5)-glutamine methyltransferase [Moraxellaceae bacterium]
MKTIKQLTKYFQTDYSDLPKHWLEDWLLYVIKKPMNFLITDSDYQLTDNEFKEWQNGINKMRNGTPLAYLIGKQAFWSLDFIVNKHTLIPRADTEVLVEQILAWIGNKKEGALKLLDLGTGSGCIAISLAHELTDWQVTAVDISEQALEVAKQNAQLNQINNIQFIKSYWFANLDKNHKYAVIVSNPPYIEKDDKHLAQLTAEPITALVADNNGLADIKQIITHAPNYLLQGGLLAIEHGYNQAEDVQKLFKQANFSEIKTIKDYGGNDRVTMGIFVG